MTEEYIYIVFCVVLICFTSIIIGVENGKMRSKIITEDFMKQFRHEHIAAFGVKEDLPKSGHPDNGNGRYA